MIDRTKAPQFVKPEYFPLQQAESIILDGGIPFHFLRSGDQQIIRLEIIFKAGRWFEEKNGTSTLAGKLLSEGGTKNFPPFEISKVFERNGAFYEISPGLDFINLSIYTLSKNFSRLTDVIKDILLNPVFAEDEIETQKSIQVQNLLVNKEKNSFLASREFRKRLFGKDHPYGKLLDEDHIEQLSREDLLGFFRSHINNNFEVVLSGGFSDEELSLIQNFFSGFSKKSVSNKAHKTVKKSDNLNLDKANSLQSSIRMGKFIIDKHDEDYAQLLIFNEVLGGYFGSRLMQNLREEKGFTYGIHSSVVPLLHDTYFIISTDVIKEHKEEAVREIYYEITRLVETLVSKTELDTVKNYFKGTFLSAINSPFSLADKFKNIYFHGLTYEYYKNLFEQIDATNAHSIKSFAERHFAKNDLLEVVIG